MNKRPNCPKCTSSDVSKNGKSKKPNGINVKIAHTNLPELLQEVIQQLKKHWQ